MDLQKIVLKGTIPFLKRQTVMFIGPLWENAGLSMLVSSSGNLRTRISNAGFKFLYLPEVFSLISSDVLSYSFPGAATFSPDFVYEQIRAGFPQMGEMPGFIVNSYGELIFYPLPAEGEFAEFIDGFISAITPEESEIRFSKGSVSEEPVLNMEKTVIRKAKRPSLLGSIFRKKIKDEDVFVIFDGKGTDPAEVETDLDERTVKILSEIKAIQDKYGISVDDLDRILGYQVRLSRLHIWHSGKITLPDFGDVEVKMDKLSKTVYFLYLSHPEGISFKELSDYSQELLDIYSALTDKDDRASIEASIDALTDPTRNSINEKVSKIKAAFRNVVTDRIAKFYYIDGKSGEKRKIALNREYIVWDE